MSSENKLSWTPAQSAAIKVKGKHILVSAAAGSGKSTVLAERIISSICDESKQYDLSKLLIATFTRDSAKDLRNKITEKLTEKVKQLPQNKHLYEQLLKLPSAMISTIDSACFTYIKKYFDRLSLPASVSIIDENLSASLKNEVMNGFISDCYEGKLSEFPDFAEFVENFISERDDGLADIFLKMYDEIENLPNGFEGVNKDNFAKSGKAFLECPFGQILTNKYKTATDYFISSLSEAVQYSKDFEAYAKFLPDFEQALKYAVALDVALSDKNYDALAALTSNIPAPPSKNAGKGKTSQGNLYLQDIKSLYECAAEWYRTVFCFDDLMFEYYGQKNADISEKIYAFLNEFRKRFSTAKLSRFSIDFNDLKHYALKLFYNDDGTVSDIAKEISSSLTEIYVDECQDLSPAQSKIFEALSVNCPIFMVGDIKQSIYGFRGADSSTFADYKRNYPVYEDDKDYDSVTVFLSNNFRSTDVILDFANTVSDYLFYTPQDGNECFKERIPYSADDRLAYDASKHASSAEVSILHCQRDGNSAATKTEIEAQAVANEICRLVNSGTSPENIAILLRSAQSKGKVFERKLIEKNIPVYTKKSVPLLETPEVQLALCLLNCCDNPYRDVFLIGALRSPIFGLTLNELIKIKRYAKKTDSFYSALIIYTEENSFEKGRYFLDFLNKMRKFAMNATVDRLLWQIYTETAFFSLMYDGTVSENEANSRRDNLISLYELSKQLSSGSRSSLYSFLENIRIMIEQGNSPSSAASEIKGVKIMTIHASKGLEFDYCFVSSLSDPVKKDSSDVVFSKSLGFVTALRDDERISKFSTPFKAAVDLQIEYESIEEEMRLLYVALTRAKRKLYLTTSVQKIDTVISDAELLSCKKHPYNLMRKFKRGSNNYLKWILTALKQEAEKPPIYTLITKCSDEIAEESKSCIVCTPEIKQENAEPQSTPFDEMYSLLKARLSFVYPHRASLKLPSKLSVSRLYPEILDEGAYYGGEYIATEDGLLSDIFEPEAQRDNFSLLKIPDFASQQLKATAADIGTATHIFMQFCSFELLAKNGVEAEISRLTEKRFMLPEHAKLIDRSVINSFLSSDIYREMMNASEISREYRFNIKLPASEFTANDTLKVELENEYIFVQGVIDCYFRDERGNITLLDYKTDRVPDNIRGHEEKENSFFINRHKRQLTYYRKALEILTGKPVKNTVIFSFALGRCINIHM